MDVPRRSTAGRAGRRCAPGRTAGHRRRRDPLGVNAARYAVTLRSASLTTVVGTAETNALDQARKLLRSAAGTPSSDPTAIGSRRRTPRSGPRPGPAGWPTWPHGVEQLVRDALDAGAEPGDRRAASAWFTSVRSRVCAAGPSSACARPAVTRTSRPARWNSLRISLVVLAQPRIGEQRAGVGVRGDQPHRLPLPGTSTRWTPGHAKPLVNGPGIPHERPVEHGDLVGLLRGVLLLAGAQAAGWSSANSIPLKKFCTCRQAGAAYRAARRAARSPSPTGLRC